uniref:Uncharacterized protein n=1 Tax=Haptolina brevifila TaxID=156173 RepID=A0A7S2FTR4_9EUKA|mmetsp:Transcript_19014/g.38749  ORF Transcript_19014/g.38749 Transcript_19014/m.38749 type:complete len:122 (+) Transcript_19014:129-494(+)|eukprot:CAMPEP_0174730250 /NCGR_PEP_ID=MMETSP1094-20130205/55226_1 /TAXON_ID=156173 /ORGANISM="Chrysochromulina brevifilum, Strain UTEX LB 985" /LENGTH=121 /DNA_ID=CAMNT_0015932483 /DNA_START=127 /DNA_END=495 /DNA_ORIENTATION=+
MPVQEPSVVKFEVPLNKGDAEPEDEGEEKPEKSCFERFVPNWCRLPSWCKLPPWFSTFAFFMFAAGAIATAFYIFAGHYIWDGPCYNFRWCADNNTTDLGSAPGDDSEDGGGEGGGGRRPG